MELKLAWKNQHPVAISALVERVFDFAANYENDPQWRSEVRRMHYRTPGRRRKATSRETLPNRGSAFHQEQLYTPTNSKEVVK
jgi:hypothetical protein